jgi:predicted Zn-dependent protease
VSATLGERAATLVTRLARAVGAVEAFEKRGRSRCYEREGESEISSTAVEAGWAVRAGDLKRSFFAAGSGELPLDGPWPQPTPHPLWLPEPQPLPAWSAPAGLDAPLAGESEARALVDAVERELARELAGARLVAARFEEGSSQSVVVSSRGVRASVPARAATLRLEAEHGGLRVTAETWAFEAREMKPVAVARRLADRLLALSPDARLGAPAGVCLLAAPLAARLVEALSPWLVGREASAHVTVLAGRGGRLGSRAVHLVDDGALAGGLLSAAADGEGLPCRAVSLVEAGRFVRPLVAWWECERPAEASGCARRASYRDLPRRAPTHLYLGAEQSVAVADLVADAAEGAYLIDAEGAVRMDPASGRFVVPVSGFALAGGRAVAGLGRRRLTGTLADWLRGVRAVARDRWFVAGDGMFGSPTLLAAGLELLEPGR